MDSHSIANHLYVSCPGTNEVLTLQRSLGTIVTYSFLLWNADSGSPQVDPPLRDSCLPNDGCTSQKCQTIINNP